MTVAPKLRVPLWVLTIIFLSALGHAQEAVSESSIPQCSTIYEVCSWNNFTHGDLKPKQYISWTLDENFALVLQGDHAQKLRGLLKSPSFTEFDGEGACLTFTMVSYNGAGLFVQVYSGKKKESVWGRISSNLDWHEESITIRKELTKKFSILINGTLYIPRKQGIFIREGKLTKGECQSPSQTSSGYKCDFETNGLGQWESSIHPDNDKPMWTIEKGIQHLQHLGNGDTTYALGHYASVSLLPEQWKETTKVLLTSPPFKYEGQEYCLRMFYFLQGGVNVGVFSIIVQRTNSKQLEEVFRVSGTQGGRWREAVATLNVESEFKVILGFTPGTNLGSMKVDDIVLTQGKCQLFDLDTLNEVTCDFASNNPACKTTSVPFYGNIFAIGKSSIEPTADTIAIHNVTTSDPVYTSIAFLHSEMYSTSKTRNCLTFDYNVKTNRSAYLFVLTSADYYISPKWYRRLTDTEGWRRGMVELEALRNYKLEFRSGVGKNTTGYAALGGFKLTNSPCPTKDSYMCNFDENQCGWDTDKTTGNLLEWTRSTGGDSRKTGPRHDMNTYTETGYYMLVNTEEQNVGGSARLTSKFFPPKENDHCFSFWYSMHGKKVSELQIIVRTNAKSTTPKDKLIWERRKHLGANFVYGQVNFDTKLMQTPFQISFIAYATSHLNDIAIDEVNFEEGRCRSDENALEIEFS